MYNFLVYFEDDLLLEVLFPGIKPEVREDMMFADVFHFTRFYDKTKF